MKMMKMMNEFVADFAKVTRHQAPKNKERVRWKNPGGLRFSLALLWLEACENECSNAPFQYFGGSQTLNGLSVTLLKIRSEAQNPRSKVLKER